jgi:ribose transport system substrate-binding protein
MGTSKRFVLYALLMLLAVAAFYSCDSRLEPPPADKKKTVALIVRMKHGDYWRTVKLGAEMAAKEYDLNLNFYAPDYEERAIELAKQPSLPIIALDFEGDSPEVKSYIGTDNYDMGQKACEKMVQLIGEKGQIALLGSGMGTPNAQRRVQGVLDVTSREPQVELVASEYVQSDKRQAGELTRELMKNHPQVKGIIALDASTSIGVAEEIEKMGLQDKVKIVAIDSPPEVLEYLQEGVISATIIQKPFSMGYLGVTNAADVSVGKQAPKRVDTGTKVIDRENMFWSENQKLLFPFVK